MAKGSPSTATGAVKVTKAKNGLTVASIDNGGALATVGVATKLGSRHETDETRGATHFLKHCVFKSNNFGTQQRFVRDCNEYGFTVDSTAGKEVSVYSMEAPRTFIGESLEMLYNGTVQTRLAPWEIEDYAEVATTHAHDLAGSAAFQMTELLHEAAFNDDSTLGQTLAYPAAHDSMNHEVLRAFLVTHLAPNRTALVGVNVDHSSLEAAAEGLEWGVASDVKDAPAVYVGGESRVKVHGSDNANVGVALNAAGVKPSVLAVLESAINVDGATSYSASYSDAGLFGVYGATTAPTDLLKGFFTAVKSASAGIDGAALKAAKAEAKVAAVGQSSTVSGLFGDLASQALTTGAYSSSAAAIDAVTEADIKAAAATLLKSKPSVASVGKTSLVPRHGEIAKML